MGGHDIVPLAPRSGRQSPARVCKTGERTGEIDANELVETYDD